MVLAQMAFAAAAGFATATLAAVAFRAYRMRRGNAALASAVDRDRDNTYRIFAMSRLRPDLVMMGDSLTCAAPWHELLAPMRVANRGLGGAGTKAIIQHLDQIIDQRPHAAYLLVGVNDLAMQASPREIGENVSVILSRLSAAGIATLASPIFPVCEKSQTSLNNEAIEAANQEIRKAIRACGSVLVDVPMADADGCLKPEYSQDGLHLTAAGYAAWRDALEPACRGAKPQS